MEEVFSMLSELLEALNALEQEPASCSLGGLCRLA